MATKASASSQQAEAKHPFAELLAQYRQRKPGLTQTRLAELAGYDQAILVRMAQGKKDLTGPSGRERVVRLIETLADQGALTTLDEANALLLAADMPPLFERQSNEAHLIERLSRMQIGHRVRRTNLPAPLTSFIGRAQEIAEVRRLLNTTRLLTLTGAGGCGKTRLAQRVAADVLIGYSEGVWYAELAALTDPTLIADSVARALGLATTDQPAQEQVLDFLRERHVLLLLDNCEHLIDAVADFVVTTLRACPRVTILTTSREALNVDGETAWRVPPMQPDEAGQLFVTRSAAARSDAMLSAGDESVLRICHRLDGMPLAIELAAARLSALSLNDIAARLDDRFNLLSVGRRGALPRHQTLRAMIDWSHDALSEEKKIAFRRLGVFVGGWELEQAEEVVGGELQQMLPILTQLVSKSLVVVDLKEGATRYRFLETLREYALEQLAEAGEREDAQRRHADAYLRLAEQSVDWLHGPHQRVWLSRLEREYPNLQAAMEWCLESGGDALAGCRIAGALYHFWKISSGHFNDALRWAKAAKNALSDEMPLAVRAWVLLEENYSAFDLATIEERMWLIHDLFVQADDPIRAAMVKPMIGEAAFYARRDFPTALRLSEEGVAEARVLGADWELRFNLWMLGQCLRLSQKDPARAESVYRESAALSQAAGDMNEYARTLGLFLSGYAMERLEFQESMRQAEEALKLAQQTGDDSLATNMNQIIAENLYYLGDVDRATEILEECHAVALGRLPLYAAISPKVVLGRIALSQGDYAQAHAHLIKALNMRRAAAKPGQFLSGAHMIVDALAALAAAQGEALRAARLRGITDSMYELNHHYRPANRSWEYAPHMAKARDALGDEAYDAAYAEGRAMTLDQAIDYALGRDPKGLEDL